MRTQGVYTIRDAVARMVIEASCRISEATVQCLKNSLLSIPESRFF